MTNMSSTAPILVTGATGNVGRNVVKQLVEAGRPVRALTRSPGSVDFPKGVEVVEGDLGRPMTLKDAFYGIECMLLITIHEDETLQAAREVAELAKSVGVRRATVMSGAGDETVVEAVESAGIACTHLQPGEFMTNTLLWAESIRTEGVVRAPFGSLLSAMIHESDIAAIAVAALLEAGHEGKTYLLTGPQEFTRTETVGMIGQAIGRDIRFVELTSEQAREQWRLEGYTEEDIEWLLELGTMGCISPATRTVEEILGRPARTFVQWAREHADAFR